jgi:hypothetical protein
MSESTANAIITAIGSLLGGIIGAYATIQAAKVKLPKSPNDTEPKFPLLGIVMGAVIGAVATLVVLAFLGFIPTPTSPVATPTTLSRTVEVTPTLGIIVANSTSEFIPKAQVTYETKFDDIMNWGMYGSTDIVDNHLVLSGTKAGATHETPLSKGNGILVLFKCSSGASANIVLNDASSNSDKYIGIQIPTSREFTVSLGYNGAWAGGQQLNGNLSFTTDHWYYGLIEIRDRGQFYLKVWDKDNPNLFNEKTLPMGTEWENLSWYGTIETNQDNDGQIEVAYYQEFLLSGK